MAGRRYLNLLREDVKRRAIGNDGFLPTHRELAKHYGCSVSSIRQAINILRQEGVVGENNQLEPVPGVHKIDLPQRNHIIGAVLLRMGYYELIEKLKIEWQRRGWFVSAYDAHSDFQDPELERQFLEQACQQGFAGVVISATPVEPLNTEFYEEMRRRGMKVAHLSHYTYRGMEKESFFLPDYRAAGRLGVAAALQHGCRDIALLFNHVSAPFMTEMREGVYELVRGLGMKEPSLICCQNWEAYFHTDEESARRSKIAQLEEHLAEFSALPERCAILGCGAEITSLGRQVLTRAGIQKKKKFFFLSLNNGCLGGEEEDGVIFDFEAQLRRALEYVCDESVDAKSIVQEYFMPTIRISKDH